MSYETLHIAHEGPASVITLNRPQKRNAITFQMMDEIEAALEALDRRSETRGIVITGDAAAFSAGMDLNDMKDVGSPKAFTAYMTRWRQLNKCIEMHPCPVLAAIEGFCFTGGLELALACDLRVGAEGSSYAITSSKIGTVPGAGGTQRLPRLVGVANALDILFSANPLDAKQAREMGLINRLVPKGGAVQAAKEIVNVYEQRAPLSLQLSKRAVYAGTQMPLDEALEFEGFLVNTIYSSNDKLEGMVAFLEKRAPRFTGT